MNLLLFVLAWLTAAPSSSCFQKDMAASVIVHTKKMTKDPKTNIVDREYGICSGIYIYKRYILTAAHCFRGLNIIGIWARGPNEQYGYPVHLVALNSLDDLALLEAPYAHKYVPLGPSPRVGAK